MTTGVPEGVEQRRYIRAEPEKPTPWYLDPTKMMLAIFVEVTFVLVAVITATVLVLISIAEVVKGAAGA